MGQTIATGQLRVHLIGDTRGHDWAESQGQFGTAQLHLFFRKQLNEQLHERGESHVFAASPCA
jgi:hypothetical protein